MSSRASTLTGTFRLTRLALRRDRWMIPLWLLGITLLVVVTASSFSELYPTADSRLSIARTIEANPGIRALTGRGFDLTTVAGLVAWRVGASGGLLAGILSFLLVIRHTRAEEESNRLELLGSAVIGRGAPLAAALVTALVANLVLLGVVAGSLIAAGLPVAGSIALGLGYLSCGLVFAGLAAISAQLTESARAANGIISALMGAAYLIRAAGDSTDARWLTWLSPIGWSMQTRAYAEERWWVPAMSVGVAALLAAIGYRLALRRDLGAGVLPSRPGPARAAPGLRSSLTLAWRLQRGPLIGWTIGMVVLGTMYGGLTESVADLTDGNAELRDIMQSIGGQQAMVDSFIATMLVIGAFVTAGYAVQAVLRLHGEEVGQRAEPLLATPVSRIGWALGHLAIALLGVLVLMTAMGLAAGLVHGAINGDIPGQLGRTLGAALVQVFAISVFAAVVFALFGLAPRWASAGWGALAAGLLIYFLGALVTLNHWLMDLSPFTHLPNLPGGELTWTPLFGLAAVTLGLIGVGLLGLRRRDLG